MGFNERNVRNDQREERAMTAASMVSSTFSLPRSGMGYLSEVRNHQQYLTRVFADRTRVSPGQRKEHIGTIYLQKRASILRRDCSDQSGSVASLVRMMGWVANGMVTVLLSWGLLCSGVAMAAEESQPKDFEYYQIWASHDGETHFAECKMKGFNLTAYSSLPQYVRSDFGGEPIGMVLTELSVGLEQPLHSAPQVQFVATLSGSWYIETTDGTRHNFEKGDLLFQDNIAISPAAKQPMHYSGTHGDEPCHQLIVQLSRPPQVDNPCPF